MRGPWGFDDTWVYLIRPDGVKSYRIIRPLTESVKEWRKRAKAICRRRNIMGDEG